MKQILFFLCVLSSLPINGQEPLFEWAKQMGGVSSDVGHSIATDHMGNVYITGEFRDTVDFNPGDDEQILIGGEEIGTLNPSIFVAKYNTNGELIWVSSFKSFGLPQGFALATDTTGNVYVTGLFNETVDFDPGPDTFNLTSSGTDFILKLDTNGSFIWAKSIGESGVSVYAIVVDHDENIFMTGRFTGTADFDPGPDVYLLTSIEESDMFLLKLSDQGDFMWAKGVGSDSYDKETRGNAIALDEANNVYTTGFFEGVVDFDPGSEQFNMISGGFRDQFILKLNNQGDFVWAKKMTGVYSVTGYGIAVSESGQVYATGAFGGTIDFDPSTEQFNLTSILLSDIFISKYDLEGNFIWAKSIGSWDHERGSAIALDKNDNVYVTGFFNGTVDFNPGLDTFYISSDDIDIYILKLDALGTFKWAGAIVGNGGGALPGALLAEGTSITIDNSDNILSTGFFDGLTDFDPGLEDYQLQTNGSRDIYIHKLRQQCTTGQIPDTTFFYLTSCDSLSTGTEEFIYPDQNGCDSIVLLTTTLQTLPETPITPADLTIQQNAPPFQVTIPEVPNATGYAWQIPPSAQILSGVNTNSITIDWDDQTTSGLVCVSAFNECGSSPAACVEVMVDIPNNIDGVGAAKGFYLFPNPTDEVLTIVFREIGNYEIVLLDALGRAVRQMVFDGSETELEVRNLPTGVYWLQIKGKEGFYFERVEIVR